MSVNLFKYMEDGADPQAQAVLAYLKVELRELSNWGDGDRPLDEIIKIARWDNRREQGYVVSLKGLGPKLSQLNVAFFEHRNSDKICAVEWHQNTENSPTADQAPNTELNSEVHQDKEFGVSHWVNHGQVDEMAEWIAERFIDHARKIHQEYEELVE